MHAEGALSERSRRSARARGGMTRRAGWRDATETNSSANWRPALRLAEIMRRRQKDFFNTAGTKLLPGYLQCFDRDDRGCESDAARKKNDRAIVAVRMGGLAVQ